MRGKKKVVLIFGTRPEAIKMAPVAIAFKKIRGIQTKICVTAQHRQMLDQVLSTFKIVPDHDLNLMKDGQTLAELTGRAIMELDLYFKKEKPDLVLAQGDTTTVLATALSCFYNRVPFAHVEAGLRTWNFNAPWPEEANRVLASKFAVMHFCPTIGSKMNLVKEGVDKAKIFVTGNTVIDSLSIALKACAKVKPNILGLDSNILERKFVLITGHRRENFGDGFLSICSAISKLAEKFRDIHFVFPVHLNPNVNIPVRRILGKYSNNVHLIPPLEYLPFVYLMSKSLLILSDSGGIQEEAPSLHKPILVMRDVTERPEAVKAGAVKLVGTDEVRIFGEVSKLLHNEDYYKSYLGIKNPYGDGHASGRIVTACEDFLSGKFRGGEL
jgi:UDP-N-acetylglucosamine 2-epimerase (non-hydrolysing)